jgi:hypothetical protein
MQNNLVGKASEVSCLMVAVCGRSQAQKKTTLDAPYWGRWKETMKAIFAVFTLLLLGSVSFATPITEQFTIDAFSIRGPKRSITFTFKSDVMEKGVEFDSITVKHNGSGTFCLPAGTTSFADPLSSFSCAGFTFANPLTTVQFFDGTTPSDTITLFNNGSRGSGGVFVSSGSVAEPAGLALLGSGLLILGGVLRRRARKGNSTRNTSGILS